MKIKLMMLAVFLICIPNIKAGEEKKKGEEKAIMEKLPEIPKDVQEKIKAQKFHFDQIISAFNKLRVDLDPDTMKSIFINEMMPGIIGLFVIETEIDKEAYVHPEYMIAKHDMLKPLAQFTVDLDQFLAQVAIARELDDRLKNIYEVITGRLDEVSKKYDQKLSSMLAPYNRFEF
jgi:hypothetical protein